jgi:hypothetical protein
VESLVDVNGTAMRLRLPPPSAKNQMQSRAAKFAVYGLVAMLVCVGGMLALPSMERSLLASQYARLMPIRHMHGQHMHDAADRFLRGE